MAVGSFPPFAEDVCNRWRCPPPAPPSYNATNPTMVPPVLNTRLFGITMGDTTSPECTDPSTASNKAMDVFKGDMLIVAGQVVMAFQGVYEEKVLTQYNVHPILAVAWEVRARRPRHFPRGPGASPSSPSSSSPSATGRSGRTGATGPPASSRTPSTASHR